MRTTLDIDDDVLDALRTLATEKRVSLGTIVSELVRKGLRGRPPAEEGDLPVFEVDDDAPPLTPEKVREALDEA